MWFRTRTTQDWKLDHAVRGSSGFDMLCGTLLPLDQTGLSSSDCKSHSKWFTPFSYSLSYSVSPHPLWLDVTTLIRIEMFCYWIKVISQKNFVLICRDCSFVGVARTQTMPKKVCCSIRTSEHPHPTFSFPFLTITCLERLFSRFWSVAICSSSSRKVFK